MERRHQCSIYVLLCDGGWDSWIEAVWKHLYVLAATVLVSCVHHVSQESLSIQHCLIDLARSDLFTITFLVILLLIQQNEQQGIKGFSFQLHEKLKNIRKRLIKWLVRFLSVILTSRSCRILSGIFVFAVLSSSENCNFQWSAFCVELIHAATYREILQFLDKVFTL